ncbi:hypothetical protein ABFY57_23300 [Paenibacillus polymyxa]|uniref:hypothetical protein n=1 Tax=Paenibacillus polymyxa TaxID=1406 RepID=UPI000C9F79A9|nr:hypothetical protein [Paenibacillus polymyxa]MEB4782523.1 hypothetical protein [Paenibacillus jamilae]MBE3649219.1 hypothetical protein [Paenibacillus polymyxa]MBY7739688.1 hypothetical protein [Paenibacillus polymyxa]MDN4078261.1 hypothetical protein [Paenibacillus polymyxa]MDN4082884.1 hypothetical protein [Paenibacillus polymyxa]
MKKYQKTAIAVLSTMAMLLAPIQAAFADEAVTTTNPPSQEVQAQAIDLFAQNPLKGYFEGGYSTDIYLRGNVTIQFYNNALGEYVINFENMTGNVVKSARVVASNYGLQSVTIGPLNGYHKVVAYSPTGGGGEYKIYY